MLGRGLGAGEGLILTLWELTVAPFNVATCMFYTGIDPFTKEEVYVARNLRDRKMQRALMQFFKPENWFEVRAARPDRQRVRLLDRGSATVANPAKGEKPGERGLQNPGYRPGRKMARRQDKKPKGKGGALRP